MHLSIETQGPEDTQKMARVLAATLPPLLYWLEGDLGAGKTTFVQGLIHSLPRGAGLRVQSPTFALAKSYDLEPRVHHLDLYRLSDEVACCDLGLVDLLEDEKSIRCLEWPERAPSVAKGLRKICVLFDEEATEARKQKIDLSELAPAEQESVLKALKKVFLGRVFAA